LGLLVFLHICANGLGSELKLMAPSPAVSQVLSLTHLISVFTICPAAAAGAELAPYSIDRSWEACA
jgi:anti-anti-sigma regulatory factor